MAPLISLIVLGFRQFDRTTGPCLESLTPWLSDPDLEFIVVDNHSPDDSAEKTANWCAQHENVRCVLSDQNLGFAGGMNLGAQHARGRWLFLVNNDTLFPAQTIEALKAVLLAAPQRVAMIGPVTCAAGNGQRLWMPDAGIEACLQHGAWIHGHPTGCLLPTYRCDFFCIAIRSDVWQSLQGLDPSFGLGYYEDFDFSLRLRDAGWEQAITEDVFILHLGSATFQASSAAKALMRRNKKLFMLKHPDAKFEHTREGNLQALMEYVRLKSIGAWSAALEHRLQFRLAALRQDLPKSTLKRWWWTWRANRALSELVL